MSVYPRFTAAGFAIVLLFTGSSVSARQGQPPLSHTSDLKNGLPTAVEHRLPAMDSGWQKRLLNMPDKRGTAVQFAHPVATQISVDSHGSWTQVTGGSLWRLQLVADGATDLNFGFDQFHLPAGATLHLLSDTRAMPGFFDGPYTSNDNAKHGQYWSAPVPGDRATLELFVPTQAKPALKLRLSQVGLGFRDAFKIYGGPGLAKQGSCNNDVVCSVGDPWRNEIRAVAAYTVGGRDACTGTMVMDTEQSFTPYFLTAFHCGLNPGNAASVVTIWNYESEQCGDLSGGSRLQTVSGAVFRASDADTDMALIELSSQPPASFNVYWAGWDRSDAIPGGSVAIHHPGVDEKAISFNLDPLTFANSCILGGTNNTHWRVDNWEDGTTEPGSSGSALFDPETRGVIGFLSGGSASCSSITSDCYGRVAAAWRSGGGASERLQPWLDPLDSATLIVDGAYNDLLLRDGFE